MFDALREAEVGDAPRLVFAHLVTAKQVWHARLNATPWTGPIWPDLDWDACAALITANRAAFAVYFSEFSEDFDGFVVYHNSRGQRFETSRRDILTHLLLHSSYHRGQLARALREAELDAPNTDFITFVRQGF